MMKGKDSKDFTSRKNQIKESNDNVNLKLEDSLLRISTITSKLEKIVENKN